MIVTPGSSPLWARENPTYSCPKSRSIPVERQVHRCARHRHGLDVVTPLEPLGAIPQTHFPGPPLSATISQTMRSGSALLHPGWRLHEWYGQKSRACSARWSRSHRRDRWHRRSPQEDRSPRQATRRIQLHLRHTGRLCPQHSDELLGRHLDLLTNPRADRECIA